ncbi:MAG TPA: MFS transporter [Caldimonas sp.]
MVTTAVPVNANLARPMTREEKKVIFASSLGTIFEWYDFYLYGALAAIIAKQFFAALDPTAAFIAALLAFASGFLVRPFGALVFGRLGDMIGRKYTFLVTILIMGTSTVLVGVLPGYGTIGVAAPIILIALRLLQGLALGGEYGGAATYVAEHAPHGRRGAYTSWIQTTATLGLFLSLIVVIACQQMLGSAAFADWGWRIPFWLSFFLLIISVWIRLSLNETPAFKRMKEEGKTSKAPLTESLANWSNGKIVLLALLGLTAGQGVVWYTGQFYALFFLTAQLKVDPTTAQIMVGASLLLGTPFFIVFGSLSDKIGRKPIIMAGCLLAALTFIPLFHALTEAANPALAEAQAKNKVVVHSDPARCSFQGSPIAREIDFRTPCDIAKRFLAQSSVSYDNVDVPAGSVATVTIGDKKIDPPAATVANGKFDADSVAKIAAFKKEIGGELAAAGYPAKAKAIDFMSGQWWKIVGILFILLIYVTMVYGPIAAMLVELFPTRIRYTSMSVPYHFGNGWFGGMLPTTAFAIVAATGNMFNGLWYPIVIAAMSFVIGTLFIRETKDVDIYAHDR